ncbi:hypothetical protein KIN20_029987, partial [Parelaphostrongylus tenuis]
KLEKKRRKRETNAVERDQKRFEALIIVVTQMVHDLREQKVPQRFEDVRQKMVQVAKAAPSCHQPQQFDRRASSERSSDLTRTTSPQFIVDSLLLSPHSLVIV